MRVNYRQETYLLLSEFLKLLTEIEISQLNADRIEDIYRILYTIKMSGAMFGFKNISTIAGILVDGFAQVREGRRDITNDLIESAILEGDRMIQLLYD